MKKESVAIIEINMPIKDKIQVQILENYKTQTDLKLRIIYSCILHVYLFQNNKENNLKTKKGYETLVNYLKYAEETKNIKIVTNKQDFINNNHTSSINVTGIENLFDDIFVNIKDLFKEYKEDDEEYESLIKNGYMEIKVCEKEFEDFEFMTIKELISFNEKVMNNNVFIEKKTNKKYLLV